MSTLQERPVGTSSPAATPAVGRRSRSERRREERRRRSRRLLLSGTAVLVVALLAVVALMVLPGRASRPPGVASNGRAPLTSGVVLLSLRDGDHVPVSALLRADGVSGKTAVVLIPAGLSVPVPGLGSMPLGDAVSASLPDASADALRNLLGITVDATWTLTPEGLAGLVDAVGGVAADVDVDIAAASTGGARTILVPAGTTHVDGRQAAYVSTWLGQDESEQQRLARFCPVLQHLLEALATRHDLAALLVGLGSASSSSVAASKTAALLGTVAAGAAASHATYDVLPVRSADDNPRARNSYRVDAVAAEHLLHSVLGTALIASAQPRVLVQVASRKAGLGAAVRRDLAAADMHYLEGGEAPPAARSLVLIGDSSAASRTRGAAVAAALQLAPSALAVSTRGQTVADVIVVLGADYHA